jgi:hypothetical protein
MNRLEEGGADIKNAVNYSEAAVQGYAGTGLIWTEFWQSLRVKEEHLHLQSMMLNLR